ncbi:hypothetical protein [Variovorax sp. Sphag1AA]|uniref:hypothetical protein n=1 Tax=Variovorax sp. Sphag1AA TaxID=2587027 RepID=UPI001622D71B|nr:hypothetical protein [Variovorax sp. Sphag1AA]MBB3181500.1 intracellular septation protein A [Variovorax sp. Sphag1AA]
MQILLAFAPFIAFAVLSRNVPVMLALAAAALVAIAQLLNDVVRHKRSIKILEVGTALLFGGLALIAWSRGGAWGIAEVRFWVDGGLFLIVAFSMLIRQPFTLQYARERVSPEIAAKPQFLRFNQILTGVWALAFLILTAADHVMAHMPEVPLWIGIAVSVGALAFAIWFTGWYPERQRRLAAAAQTAQATRGANVGR